ncbi:MAG: hypothetical protein SangKO_057780 [Sandaracinaceae bacterium]
MLLEQPAAFEVDPRLLEVLKSLDVSMVADLATVTPEALRAVWIAAGHPADDLRGPLWMLREILADYGGHLAWDHPPRPLASPERPAGERPLPEEVAIPEFGVRAHFPGPPPQPTRSNEYFRDWKLELPTGDTVCFSIGKRSEAPGLEQMIMGTTPSPGAEQRHGDWGCLVTSTWNPDRFNCEAAWFPATGVSAMAYYYRGTPGEALASWLRAMVLGVQPLA